MAIPGALFAIWGLGFVDIMPKDMDPTEKFAVVGIGAGALRSAIAVVVGILKISLPVNSWLLKDEVLAKMQFFVAVPGFALVAYSHRALSLPLGEDVPCVVLPLLIGILAFTSESPKAKIK